jgi:hypothetical protein
MYLHPTTIPQINKKKLDKFKNKNETIVKLYSNEGIYQIKNNKLYKIYYIDDEKSNSNITLNSQHFIVDNSEIKYIYSNKIPFNFKKKTLLITTYETSNCKIIIEEDNNRNILNVYFYVKDPSIYEFKNEIKNFLEI